MTLSPEQEFKAWLDTVSVDIMNTPIVRPVMSLDERVALKEKLIKRKIEARMRRQRNKRNRFISNQLTSDEIEACLQRKLNGDT